MARVARADLVQEARGLVARQEGRWLASRQRTPLSATRYVVSRGPMRTMRSVSASSPMTSPSWGIAPSQRR